MAASHGVRIIIADDHHLIAEMVKHFLEPEFEVVGIVNDGRALVRLCDEVKPDVVVVDLAMPLLNGLDAIEQIKHATPRVKVICLTMNMDPHVVAEAFRRGASGYLPKSAAATEMVTALRRIVRGESYLSTLITRDTMGSLLHGGDRHPQEPDITMRQREVLQLLAEGKSMKEVAYTLDLKTGTVAFHKYRIMATLGIKTNAELLQYAIKKNLIAA